MPTLTFQRKAMTTEEGPSVVDSIVTEYATYEHYLDSQVNSTDLYYLEVCGHTHDRASHNFMFIG